MKSNWVSTTKFISIYPPDEGLWKDEVVVFEKPSIFSQELYFVLDTFESKIYFDTSITWFGKCFGKTI